MSLRLPKPDLFQHGWQRLSRTELNQIVESLYSQIVGDGRVAVKRVGDRIILTSPDDNSSVAHPVQAHRYFVVIQESYDWILCSPFVFDNQVESPYLYDPNEGISGEDHPTNEQIYIAKPTLLQKTMWDSQIVTQGGIDVTYTYSVTVGKRTASGVVSGDPVTEDQYITPSYFPGEIITARYGPTSIKTPPPPGSLLILQSVWTDTNEGGRVWATVCPCT